MTDIEQGADGFTVRTDDGEYDATYVVFATGTDTELSQSLGYETTDDSLVDVDSNMRTSVGNAFAVGSVIRDQKWEAVISAGDGGAAALQILSDEAGRPTTSTHSTGSNNVRVKRCLSRIERKTRSPRACIWTRVTLELIQPVTGCGYADRYSSVRNASRWSR